MSIEKANGRGGKRPGAGRKPGPTSDAHRRYSEARALKEESLARIRKAEADEREGRLLDRDEVAAVWGKAAETVRAHLLALPSRAAPEVVGVSVREAEVILRDHIHDALAHLVADIRGQRHELTRR